MTPIDPDDTVVYEVALCTHPAIATGNDGRSNEELIETVEGHTATRDDIDFPDWKVFVSAPPDFEKIRYVNTESRINVLAEYGSVDPFEEILDRVYVSCYPEDPKMSHWGATHVDDFDGEIHLDLTEE